MFEYLSGKLDQSTPTYAVLDIGGVGYGLLISLFTFQSLKGKEQAKIYTHLYVREDDMRLYGFATLEERDIFRLLITVSGIGTNTAIIILSSMSPNQTAQAIQSEDVEVFRSVKGIGPKTAKRIILDLKDKVAPSGSVTSQVSSPTVDNTIKREALSALVNLGFKRQDVIKMINEINQENKDVPLEELIKLSLQKLSS